MSKAKTIALRRLYFYGELMGHGLTGGKNHVPDIHFLHSKLSGHGPRGNPTGHGLSRIQVPGAMFAGMGAVIVATSHPVARVLALTEIDPTSPNVLRSYRQNFGRLEASLTPASVRFQVAPASIHLFQRSPVFPVFVRSHGFVRIRHMFC